MDIKSTVTKKLDQVIRSDDEYLLSHWPNDKFGHRHSLFGRHVELGVPREYQQWHIVAAPEHPFLEAVIQRVKRNIETYNPVRDGVGFLGTLKTTGPIAYTLGIQSATGNRNYRMVDIEELGFRYSYLETDADGLAHKSYFEKKSYLSDDPIVAPNIVDESGRLVRHWEKIERDQSCPCGSGKRYKHCHGVEIEIIDLD